MIQQAPQSPYSSTESWKIVETAYNWERDLRAISYPGESIFALGNGLIGLRGAFEEGLAYAVHPNDTRKRFPPDGKLADGYFLSVDGTYLNGFYETLEIVYPETGYGYAKNSQTVLNVPNGKIIHVLLGDDEEPLHIDLSGSQILDYCRALDMQGGLLERMVTWRSPKGHELELRVKRLVSFEHPHLVAIEFCLIPHFDGRVQITSILDDTVENVHADSDPRMGCHLKGRVLSCIDDQPILGGEGRVLLHDTKNSGLRLASAVYNQLTTNSSLRNQPVCERVNDLVTVIYDLDAQADEPITLHKYLAYRYADKNSAAAPTLMADAQTELDNARNAGFAELERGQRAYMQRFWDEADVNIVGKTEDDTVSQLQQGIRFNMFHLLEAAGNCDGQTNIGAKGLTGEGYEGHYFWDSEMFAAPFFQHVKPEICRSLLDYRHRILEQARQHARVLSLRGAAFPWRTINGEECSAYFPGGSAQYHINADIAYAIKNYVAATGDTDFLIDKGAEIVFETARMWADLGDYVPARDNAFCIHEVTGPDEYTALTDNNCYTNLMAQANLRFACDVAEWLKANDADAYEEITLRRLNPPLAEYELSSWARAAEKMYIPYDKQTGLFAQDDGFFNRAAWRWDWGTRDGKDVLLKRFHYLVLYRHQICKQADVVLALHLLPQHATLEEKRRNFNYYEQITTHDSSLSTCTFSIVASEIGYRGRAYKYFNETARMDLDDRHGNVTAGVHVANMAGTWMSVVNGFAGLRLESGKHLAESTPHFKPYLPEEWQEYRFRLHHHGCLLQVTIKRSPSDQEPSVAEYTLLSGGASQKPLRLKHYDIPFILDQSNPARTLSID